MFVESIMIPNHVCFTIQKDASILEARELLEKHEIDGLPVLDGNTYIGVLTRFQVYKQFFESDKTKDDYLNNVTAGEVAVHQDIFLQGDEPFESTLIMLKDFPLLAVVEGDDHHFLGAVTRYDVLEQFQSAFGMKKHGIRIAITTSESKGRLADLASVFKKYDKQIISLVTFDETDKLTRRIVLKIENTDKNVEKRISKLTKKIEDTGFHILDIYEE